MNYSLASYEALQREPSLHPVDHIDPEDYTPEHWARLKQLRIAPRTEDYCALTNPNPIDE